MVLFQSVSLLHGRTRRGTQRSRARRLLGIMAVGRATRVHLHLAAAGQEQASTLRLTRLAHEMALAEVGRRLERRRSHAASQAIAMQNGVDLTRVRQRRVSIATQ